MVRNKEVSGKGVFKQGVLGCCKYNLLVNMCKSNTLATTRVVSRVLQISVAQKVGHLKNYCSTLSGSVPDDSNVSCR